MSYSRGVAEYLDFWNDRRDLAGNRMLLDQDFHFQQPASGNDNLPSGALKERLHGDLRGGYLRRKISIATAIRG
jgi:hypothetical protein